MARPGDNMLRRLRFMASPQFLDAASKAVYEAADTMRAEAFRSISVGSVSGKGHTPSKPGEPPNRDSAHPARPFMRPARDRVQPEAARILEKQIERARRKFRRG